jgi:hypothetical protein
MCWQLWGRTWTCSRYPQFSCMRARNCWSQTWPLSQAVVLLVANAMLPPSEESQASQVKHQRYVCELFGLWGHSSAGICPWLWLIIVTAERFCNVWGCTCIEYVQNSGDLVSRPWHCVGTPAVLVQQFWLLKTGFWSPDIPYLPHLAGYDLFLFPIMKFQLQVCCYMYVRDIQDFTCDSKNLLLLLLLLFL